MSDFTTPPRQSSKALTQPQSASTASSAAMHSTQSTHSSVDFVSPSVWRPSRHRRTFCCSSRQQCGSGLRWVIIFFCVCVTVHIWRRPDVYGAAEITSIPERRQESEDGSRRYLSPALRPKSSQRSNPEDWLRKNSNDAHAFEWEQQRQPVWRRLFRRPHQISAKPKAAIISLVRNEELEGIMQSMRQLEYRWNHKYRYPWIFFNEKPFSDDFKAVTSNLTSSPTFYELISPYHWSTPSRILRDRYISSLDYLGTLGVGKASLQSYRRMCRWNSGFFYKHPALADYDFYWRVEPDVHFFCDIPYDPFRFLSENGLVYGFNMVILDDARSFPGLWRQTRKFIERYSELLHDEADLDWLMHQNTGEYNGCQFFSNFEIGDLKFFRSEANERYFHFLDGKGGFYYERFGDAPIHTLSLAMFAPKDRLWFFRDIGYQHDIARHCPPPTAGIGSSGMCTCEPTGLDENFYKLVPMESPQKKPDDTCVRLFLGGEKLLEKERGWSAEAERAFGGDGYKGYVEPGNGLI